MVKRRDQEEHDRMVRVIAKHLKENGHSNIKADLPGYDEPDLIYWESTKEGHYPDVASTKDQEYIFEVETDDSIDDSHTEDQWKLFSANATVPSKQFIVVIPKGLEEKARQRARELRINIDDVWTVG